MFDYCSGIFLNFLFNFKQNRFNRFKYKTLLDFIVLKGIIAVYSLQIGESEIGDSGLKGFILEDTKIIFWHEI